jgi:hypothetical protein
LIGEDVELRALIAEERECRNHELVSLCGIESRHGDDAQRSILYPRCVRVKLIGIGANPAPHDPLGSDAHLVWLPARQPLTVTGLGERVDIKARIHGGGISSQADALRRTRLSERQPL